MTKGTVKFFNASKKYGFIAPDDGGKDVFFESELDGIKESQQVLFEVSTDSSGDHLAIILASFPGNPTTDP